MQREMPSGETQVSAPTKPPRIFFGWKVVATAFTVTFFSAGIDLFGPPVYLHVLHAQHGWPISLISSAITTHFLAGAATLAYLANRYGRYGTATITRAGVAASAFGVVCWATASMPWQLFGAAILTGAGWATGGPTAVNVMVAPWFERRRPAALAYAQNGVSIAGILFVPIWIALIDRVGFTAAAALVGGTILVVIWPLAGQYLRPTPATMGLAPDGDPDRASITTQPVLHSAASLRTVAGSRVFVTLAGAFALGMFAQVGVVAHLVARVAPTFGNNGAAMVVSLSTACAIAGRTLLIALFGTVNRRVAAAGNFVMQACGVTLLAFGSDAIIMLAGAVLFGLGIGHVLLLLLIVQAEFDRADVARVVGWAMALNAATFAFGPACLGALRDLSGSYTTPFSLAALVQVAAAIIVLVGKGSSRVRGDA